MSEGEKFLRVFRTGEQPPKQLHYWLTRPMSERLAATLALHREGNEIFKRGNPPFSYTMRFVRVEDLETRERISRRAGE